MKKITGLVLLAASVVQAGTYTLTGGGSFSAGSWNDALVPPVGGSVDAALVLSLADGWSIANNLGVDGWFALNSISFANDVGGTLSGDGLAFGGDGPSAAFNGNTTLNAPIRLDADTTFSGSREVHLYGDIAGNGKLTVDWEPERNYVPGRALHFHGKRTGTGDTFVRYGLLHVYDSDGLGSGTVYVDEPTWYDFKRVYVHFAGTIPNAFVLGPETGVFDNQEVLHVWENTGAVTFTGPLTVDKSKIFIGSNNQVRFEGDISGVNNGSYIVFCVNTGSDVYLGKKLTLPNRLTVSWEGRLHLCVPGNDFSELWFYNNGWLICDADYVLPQGHNFGAIAGSTGHIDLNGHSQIVGNALAWNSGSGAPVFFYNSCATSVPTLTMRATQEHKNAHLRFYGPMNVVKEGGQLLMIMEPTFVDGNLTVTDGALKFMVPAAAGTKLAKTITVTGGALDLGGGTWRCDRLLMTGGCIQNGVLECDSSDIGPNATCWAELTGHIVHRASGNARQMIPTVEMSSHYAYTLPEGTVVYYPFDGSADDMAKDFGGGGHDLVVDNGSPAYSEDGKNGGCLYVDGGSWFRLAGDYPVLLPHGAEPYTVVAWVKWADGCPDNGGWVSYGDYYNGGGNSFRYRGHNAVQNYWNQVDVNGDTAGISDGAWHQVAGTWDGEVRRLYYDGQLVSSDMRAPNTGRGIFQIGKTMYDVAMKGWIDDVLIMRRAMTDQEVKANFDGGGVPSRKITAASQITVAEGNVALDIHRQAVYYPFDSAETLFDDASGNNAALKSNNPDSTGATCDTVDVPAGATGGSLKLDGNTELVARNGFPASMPIGSSPYTVCAFVKLDPGSDNGGGWFSYGNRDNSRGNSFHAFNNMRIFENYWNNCDMRDYLPNNATFDDGWHSIVCVFYGGPGGRRIHYFDGNLWIPYEWMWWPDIGADIFMIGNTMWSRAMQGHVDELAVYNYALSPVEVAAYHANVRAPEPVVTYPSNLDLEVMSGASVSIPPGVALHNLHGQGMVNGDATLADGAVLDAEGGAVAISGTLTIGGAATVMLPDPCPRFAKWMLFSPSRIDRAERLSDWTIHGNPKGTIAEARVKNGNVIVWVRSNGVVVYVR